MKSNNKHYLYFTVICLVVIGFNELIYHILSITDINAETNLIARNIETPAKLWLNGYIGVFFGFKYLGNINWLLLPLAFTYFIKNKQTLRKQHYALLVFMLLALLLIGVKGFFNPRYQLTLLVIIVLLVFYFTYNLSAQLTANKKITLYSLCFLVLLIFSNFYRFALSERFVRKFNTVFFPEKLEPSSGTATPLATTVNMPDSLIVDDIFAFISKLPRHENILTNNAPDIYYYTNKKALYYWSGDDHYYSPKGRMHLTKDKTSEQVRATLVNEYNCYYIYLPLSYLNYNKTFDKVISEYCTLIAFDKEQRLLFKINI